MMLPYLQIDQDFIGPKATLIAARLKVSRHQAIGMGADLFAFAINMTSKDDSPPTGLFDYPEAAEDLEFAMGWTGEAGKAVDAFTRAGVIERRGEGYRVCGTSRYDRTWKKNRHAWGRDSAADAPQSGTDAAAKVPQSGDEVDESPPPSGKHAAQTPPQPRRKSAAKVPEDEDEDEEEETKKESDAENKQPLSSSPDGDSTTDAPEAKTAPEVREVFDYWRQRTNRPKARLDTKRIRLVKAQLQAGRTVDELKRAIDGCAASAWHQGQNDRGKPFTDLELILRDARHVEDFIAMADAAEAAAPPGADPPHVENPCAKCGSEGRYVTWGGVRVCVDCCREVAELGLHSVEAVQEWVSAPAAAGGAA